MIQSRAFLDKLAKLAIPMWAGQISRSAGYVLSLASGVSIGEATPDSVAAAEIARLWSAIKRSVDAINAARAAASALRDEAA